MQTERGQSIEDASMRIIDGEVDARDRGRYDTASEWPIVRRVIHATADFDFAGRNRMVFGEDAVGSGTRALRGGCGIVVDVNGVIGGMNKQNPRDYGNRTVCNISSPEVMETARSGAGQGRTRSQISMRASAADIDGGVVAVGNAPTALREVAAMVREGAVRPALVIGIPVGFVDAAESKAELAAGLRCGGGGDPVPFITNVGRKGGSPPASAIINALFRLIREGRA